MALSPRARQVLDQVAADGTKLGDIKRVAKDVKKDHALAMELWSSGNTNARLLAVLILDRKKLDQALVDKLDADLQALDEEQRTRIMDWLFANQLAKSAAGKQLIETWEHSPSALQRRTFWYHQARLRWTGQDPPDNTAHLLDALEARLADEDPQVQWAMNFTAGQIGVFQPEHRARCVALGERTGLYRDQVVPKNCTPNYLPEFIRIQADKVGT